MSAVSPAAATASQQAVVEAALMLLERMGLSPADLVAAPRDRGWADRRGRQSGGQALSSKRAWVHLSRSRGRDHG
jgi:hypothetical protein